MPLDPGYGSFLAEMRICLGQMQLRVGGTAEKGKAKQGNPQIYTTKKQLGLAEKGVRQRKVKPRAHNAG